MSDDDWLELGWENRMSVTVSRESGSVTPATVATGLGDHSHPTIADNNGDGESKILGNGVIRNSHENNEDNGKSKEGLTDGLVPSPELIPEEIRRRAQSICEEFEASQQKLFPRWDDRQRQYRNKLQERLWTAACWRDYQLACVQRAFEAEVKQIEAEYESEKTNLKEKLLGELMEERRRLAEGKEQQRGPTGEGEANTGGSIANNNTTGRVSRKLRSKRGADVGEGGRITVGTGGRRKQALTGLDALGVTTSLPEQDVYEDLVLILKDENGTNSLNRKTRQKATSTTTNTSGPADDQASTTTPIPITLKGDSVKIGQEELFKGDAVLISTPDGSQFTGTISGLGNKEVYIRIEDGAKLKINFLQLQAGRYRLQHTPDATSNGDNYMRG